MDLYLLRHAIAVERVSANPADDSQRPLTPEGMEKMRQGARGIKALELSFDLVLSSPYLRARETAEIVMKDVGIKNNSLMLTENLTPDASFEGIVREINVHSPKPRSILLVGHEPHLSGLVSFLLTDGQGIAIDFKKGGLCPLSAPKTLAAGSAALRWLLTPAQLRRIH